MSSTVAPSGSLGQPVSQAGPPKIVLDTNVVLDWLVFRNPCCARLDGDFTSGRLRWLASTAMKDELAHVLGRGVGNAWAPDMATLWSTWERHVAWTAPIPPMGAATRMRCTDTDDQKFIDLALAHGAKWLLSRDRAVLKLGRRTRPLGLEVLTPEAWLAAFSRDAAP
jgi:predicted nucleic acid-binding protein